MKKGTITIKYKIGDKEVIKIFGKQFIERNKYICKMEINGKELYLNEYYAVDKELNDFLEIKLNKVNRLTDISYMFEGCRSLLSLSDISDWKSSNVTNMSYMFSGCISLLSLSNINI